MPSLNSLYNASKGICSLLGVLLLAGACSTKHYTDPLSPGEALKSFRLNNDFIIEIFAAEPFVLDPVDMVFDEEGKAYVVEMPDYPYQPEAGKKAGSIRLLRDADGDGRIDHSTVFADSLSEATSVLPWKGGLIVTAAPHILYLKDTNGDYRADTREVMFSGFFRNNPEAQITCLRFGIDNWIYANNRGQDGLVSFAGKAAAAPLSVRGADFRFRLDRGQFEPETGPGQFGQTIDQWGHRFFTENSIHLQQAVIPWRYLHRHPFLPSTAAVVNISDHDPIMFQETSPPYWRAERTGRRNRQYQEENLTRKEYGEDHFTGASGGTIYTGDAFPEQYYGNVFTGDVAGNLVHRDVLTLMPDSVRFVAKRGAEEKNAEFLSSSDPWFRPVNFSVGPDGYLYVIDMYRQHIETPVSIPEDLQEDMDFLRGRDKGRIYRLRPKAGGSAGKAVPNFRDMTGAQLVESIASTRHWQAMQAHKLLLERQEVAVAPAVRSLFLTHKNPGVRIHAFYVLEGLNALDASLVKLAIEDVDPNLRENGIILSERYPEHLPLVIKATMDPVARVALQATLSLGEFQGRQIFPALAAVIEKHYDDPWFRKAVLSAEAGSSAALPEVLLKRGVFFEEHNPGKESFIEDISFITALSNRPGEMHRLLGLSGDPSFSKTNRWKLAVLSGIAGGLKKSGTSRVNDPRTDEVLQKIYSGGDAEIQDAVNEVRKLLSK